MKDLLYTNNNTTTGRETIEEAVKRHIDIFNSFPIAVGIYDEKANLIDCNEISAYIFGYKNKEDLIASQINALDDEATSLTEKNIGEFLKEKKSFFYTIDFDKAKRTGLMESQYKGTKTFQVNTTPLKTIDGQTVGIIAIANDTTKKLHIEEEHSILNIAINILLGVGNVSVWKYNIEKDCFKGIFGNNYLPDGANYDFCRSTLCPESVPILDLSFENLISGKSTYEKGTAHFINPQSGQKVYTQTELAILKNKQGKREYIIGIQKDVTEALGKKFRLEEFQKKTELIKQKNGIIQWDYDVKTKTLTTQGYGALFDGTKFTAEDYLQFVHPDDRQNVREKIGRLAKAELEEYEMVFRCLLKPNSEYRTVLLNCIAIHDANKNTISYTGLRQDITDSIKNKRELEEYKIKTELVNKANDIVQWDYDIDNFFLSSKSDDSTIGVEGIYYNDFIKLVHPSYKDKVEEKFQMMHERRLKDADAHLRALIKLPGFKDYKMLEMAGVAIKDSLGNIIKYTGYRQDISKWVEINQQLLIQNEELNRAKEKAEESEKLKQAFLANMSHEIRTPLNAIVGFSELLIESNSSEERAEYSKIISKNNELLLRIVNDVLDLSKIEAGMLVLNKETFDFSEMFDEMCMSMSREVVNPKVDFIRLNPFRSCIITADRYRLKQVISNFITNAIKYTKEGSINITYTYEDGYLKIIVTDTGEGIDKDYHDIIFERFRKGNDFVQGTGLGLSICKAIIENMNGEIDFESELGKGCKFWAQIPCNAVIKRKQEKSTTLNVKEQVQTEEIKDEEINGKKLLVAEDSNSNFLLIKHILKGWNITRVKNGAEAVEAARSGEFEIILMDIRMPIMDGLTATKKIKEFNKDIKIIAVTANAFDSDKEEALKIGCSAFIAKPIRKNALLSLLR